MRIRSASDDWPGIGSAAPGFAPGTAMTWEHREPSGEHPTLTGSALDAALGRGQFVIGDGRMREYVCRDRQEMLEVVARDYAGRSDFFVRWKRTAQDVEIARAPLRSDWGTAY